MAREDRWPSQERITGNLTAKKYFLAPPLKHTLNKADKIADKIADKPRR